MTASTPIGSTPSASLPVIVIGSPTVTPDRGVSKITASSGDAGGTVSKYGKYVVGCVGRKKVELRTRPFRKQFAHPSAGSWRACCERKRRKISPFQTSSILCSKRLPNVVSFRQQVRTSPSDVTQ